MTDPLPMILREPGARIELTRRWSRNAQEALELPVQFMPAAIVLDVACLPVRGCRVWTAA